MFIDSHCHLDFTCFDNDRARLLLSLSEHNISHLIIPATERKYWPRIIELATQHATIYFSLGIHPHFLDAFQDHDLIELKKLLTEFKQEQQHQCIALGEIGLDKLVDIDFEQQEKVFIAQLKIAQSLALPVILHVVKTQSRVLQLLKQVGFQYGGVYHAFSGSEAIANEFIKLGFKLGIGGVITRPTAVKTCSTIAKLPIDSLLLETDAPDMPIYQQQEKINSPLNIKVIFSKLCQLRKETPENLERNLYLNTKSIFSINHD